MKSFETTFIWNNCWQLLLTLNFKTRSDVNVVISTFPQLIPLLTLHIFRFLGKTLAKRCEEILNSSQYPLKQYVCFQILPSMNVDSNRHGGLCAHYGCMHVNSGHDLKNINNVIRIKFFQILIGKRVQKSCKIYFTIYCPTKTTTLLIKLTRQMTVS